MNHVGDKLRISLYWDDKRSKWLLTIPSGNRSSTMQTTMVATTAPLDTVNRRLLLNAIKREMESWLD
uniref:Uncharacterized protein n=1 Tax=uncultured prokaryote TaxID=198431 RepID=A0A0H5Q7B0_9ZZZZ|nr:hypothetical protein [uncultured prokaryote]